MSSPQTAYIICYNLMSIRKYTVCLNGYQPYSLPSLMRQQQNLDCATIIMAAMLATFYISQIRK